MDNADNELLLGIGLTPGEVKVYLALLRLGETKTGALSKAAQVSSSKVYKILDRLAVKGLCGFVTRGKTRFFSAVEPKRILEYVEKKENELREKRALVEQLVPKLEAQLNSAGKPNAVVYEGFKAVTNAVKNIVDELPHGGEYLVLGATYGETDGARPFFFKHHKNRVKKGIMVKMLANNETRGNLEATTLKNAQIRYLPQQFASNTAIFVYLNKTIIVIWAKNPTAFLMTGEDAAENFKTYFQTLWKIARK